MEVMDLNYEKEIRPCRFKVELDEEGNFRISCGELQHVAVSETKFIRLGGVCRARLTKHMPNVLMLREAQTIEPFADVS